MDQIALDQEAWSQIYSDLEQEMAEARARGAILDEMAVVLQIDRARFALDRGDAEEAIGRIQQVQRILVEASGEPTRSGGATVGAVRLDKLEDELHSTTRLGSARLEIVGEEEEEPTRAASQNTKVNKSIKYEDIKDEILKMWTACTIRPDKAEAVRREADRVVQNRKVYEEISARTQVPWWFIGLIHGMECSFSLGKHLHNGDSLKARTWQVPAGRPKDGSPPFTFQESAIDALEVDGFAGKTDWPLEMVLFRLERYNGFGYRKKFGFASPYLWSYTNHFSSGKYVKDGVFDANATSKQCGAAAMLRDLLQRGVVKFEEKKPEPVVAAAPVPASAPAAVPPSALATSPAPKPAEAPVPVASAPVASPAPVPTSQPPSAPASPAPAAPASAVPAAKPAEPVLADEAVAPKPATPSAPLPAPAGLIASAPASFPSAPDASAPVASTAPPDAAGAAPVSGSASAPASGAADASSVSPAVAAALAELAKRSHS